MPAKQTATGSILVIKAAEALSRRRGAVRGGVLLGDKRRRIPKVRSDALMPFANARGPVVSRAVSEIAP